MSLFETELSEATRSFVSTVNVMEANRSTADLIEQLGTMLREAGIANHACLVVHAHYFPTQIDYRIIVYQRAEGLQRIFELIGAVTSTRGGIMKLCGDDHYKKNTVFLEFQGHHYIDLDFEAEDVSREILADVLKKVEASEVIQ